ncbi:MAG: NosD domain-containing protein [Planctomycetota bacterium]
MKLYHALYGLCSALTVAGPVFASEADGIVLGGRFTFASDAKLKPGTYRIADPDEGGAVQIVGDGITVDFQGAELIGCEEDTPPDSYSGRGIVVRGRNVTLKNAKIRGYKVGIYAEDSPGVTITGCDVSRNYRQRLLSTVEREDLSDWLYGHENDENQWLRYGAGIYLLRCPRATVSKNRGRNGQNGLCLSRCDDSVMVDNDLSFMSGWGIALWRTSRCDVSRNKTDWCIRGYSHGVYSRGQDSAGILVYEQCSDNVFAYNSATHSGDGFFLYAGNETLQKTGEGGCNRNLVYRNDFSHAAANGIECTFSGGNAFVENLLNECDHGVWAGYSYNTLIVGNRIADCNNGVSIEHGHDNLIAENTITNTRVGIHLWWDDDADLLASVFGRKQQNCPSTRNRVVGNIFERVKVAVRLADDTYSAVRLNWMEGVETGIHLLGHAEGTCIRDNALATATTRDEAYGERAVGPNEEASGYPYPIVTAWVALLWRIPPVAQMTQNVFLPEDHPRGRKYIFVDEWGPYDFTDVRLFPRTLHGGDRATLQVLGPSGGFKVAEVKGDVHVSPMEGGLPGQVTITADQEGVHDFSLAIDAGGRKLTATGTLLRADWTVRFFAWEAAADPRENQAAWDALLQGPPLEERRVSSMDFIWGGAAPGEKVPPDRFGTLATARLRLPAGVWNVHTVSDDGIRVWIDGRRIIDDWTWHPPKENAAPVELEEGEHAIRIEHFEIDGHAQLQFRLDRR